MGILTLFELSSRIARPVIAPVHSGSKVRARSNASLGKNKHIMICLSIWFNSLRLKLTSNWGICTWHKHINSKNRWTLQLLVAGGLSTLIINPFFVCLSLSLCTLLPSLSTPLVKNLFLLQAFLPLQEFKMKKAQRLYMYVYSFNGSNHG